VTAPSLPLLSFCFRRTSIRLAPQPNGLIRLPAHSRRRTAPRWSLVRPPPFLGELPVLPPLIRRTPHPGAGRPIRLIEIHRRQSRPVSTLVLRRKQPLNPGDEGVQAANHSSGIRPQLPDSDHSIGVWFVFAGSLIIFFFSRLILNHRVQRRQAQFPPKPGFLQIILPRIREACPGNCLQTRFFDRLARYFTDPVGAPFHS